MQMNSIYNTNIPPARVLAEGHVIHCHRTMAELSADETDIGRFAVQKNQEPVVA